MIIFTNCLTETVDEGCLKIANSLIGKLKKTSQSVTVISYERKSSQTDVYVNSNKFLLTKDIIKALRETKEDVLYIPFPARSVATAIRIFILSLIVPKSLGVLFSQVTNLSIFAKILLKLCRADFYVLSDDTQKKLESFIIGNRIRRLKVGVQTDKFIPVSSEDSIKLKEKYGFLPYVPVILHVGHLNEGRNVSELMKISSEYQVLLVVSTLTKDEQNLRLKEKLLKCKNIRIIDDYLPNIQEIYQLSDVYFFPVVEQGHCIDVPLSCLEAASCNKPVVTTDFGEMKAFLRKKGFYFISSFEKERLNDLIEEALSIDDIDTRSFVLEYDWDESLKRLLNAE